MGARQSKRSVDITTTPKKDGATPSDGSVAGDAAAPGDGKLERIEETDGKPTTNGTANNHPDSSNNDEKDSKDKEQEKEKDKDKDKDEDTEKDHDNRAEDTTRSESKTEAVVLAEEATTPTESQPPTSPDATTSPESKDTKKKEKKKWSFRSLSFGKRDRSKTTREGGTPKNGDVAKTEPLAEGGEEAEAVLQSVDEIPVENKPEVLVDEVAVSPAAAVTSSTVESESNPVVPDEVATAAAEELPSTVAASPIKEKEAPPPPPPTSQPPPPAETSNEVSPLNVNNDNIVNKLAAATLEEPEAKEKIKEKEETEEKEKEKEKETTAAVVAQQEDENKEATTTTTTTAAAATAESVESGVEQQSTITTEESTNGVILLDNTEVSQSNRWLVKRTGSGTPSSTTSQAQASVEADNEVEVKSSPPSIIERKTSEELPTPPPLPSSPPPTPIDPSPLENAAASPSALAEALKVPAEAAANDVIELAAKNYSKSTSNDTVVNPIKEKEYENLNENEKQENLVDPEHFSYCSLSLSSSSCQLPPPSTVYSFSIDIEKEDGRRRQVFGEKMANFCDKEEEIMIVSEDKKEEENGMNDFVNDSEIDTQVKVTADIFSSDSISKEFHSRIEDGEKEKEEGDSVIVEAKPALVVNEDNNIETSKVIGKLEEDEEPQRRENHDKREEEKEEEGEIVPPLPESPIPNFDKTVFTKELDSEAVFDPIEELRASHLAAEGNAAVAAAIFKDVGSTVCFSSSPPPPSSSSSSFFSSSSFITEEKKSSKEQNDCPALLKNYTHSDELKSLPKINDTIINTEREIVFTTTNGDKESDCDIIKSNIKEVLDIDNFVNESKNSSELLSEFDQKMAINGTEVDNDDFVGKKIESFSSLLHKNEDQKSSSNEEFEVESISQSLHSYKDSDEILKERFDGKSHTDDKDKDGDDDDDDDDTATATATTTNSSLPIIEFSNTTLSDNNTSTTNDLPQDRYADLQKIAEPESASVENQTEISTTENVTEITASPAPLAPVVEVLPILPPSEPAITEDVASVTKAIEETDISDKAVAAAVNEAIESVNANDLVNESLHQNIIKE